MAAPSIVLVASSDSVLEATLKACGRVSVLPTEDGLATLGRHISTQPDVIVVDQRGRAALPLELALFKRQYPSAGVIIVASQLDPAQMLEAMRAGITEWVVDPITRAELEAAILRVVAQRAPRDTGQAFVFIGAKGGVGTTTLAVNTATWLTKATGPGSTLMADLHVAHSDTAVSLGVEPRFSSFDALQNTHRLDEAFFRGLAVRTKAGPDLLGSAMDAITPIDATRVRALLEFVVTQYRFVVLDVPRSNLAMLDSLEPAARIVIVVNQELATVRNASRLAKTLLHRYGPSKLQIVLNRYDPTFEIGRDDVERVVGSDVKSVFPSASQLTLASLHRGWPLVLDNHSVLAASIASFAQSLAGLNQDVDGRKSGGLLGLWSRS